MKQIISKNYLTILQKLIQIFGFGTSFYVITSRSNNTLLKVIGFTLLTLWFLFPYILKKYNKVENEKV